MRTCEVQVACAQQNLVTNIERHICTLSISVLLLQLLRSYQSTLNLIKQSMPHFNSGLCRFFGVQPIQVVHRHSQQLTVSKGSRQYTSRICYCIVSTILQDWNSFHPINNSLMIKCMYDLFDGTVLMFCSTIGLWVIGTTKQSLHSEHGTQGKPE